MSWRQCRYKKGQQSQQKCHRNRWPSENIGVLRAQSQLIYLNRPVQLVPPRQWASLINFPAPSGNFKTHGCRRHRCRHERSNIHYGRRRCFNFPSWPASDLRAFQQPSPHTPAHSHRLHLRSQVELSQLQKICPLNPGCRCTQTARVCLARRQGSPPERSPLLSGYASPGSSSRTDRPFRVCWFSGR